MHQEYVFTSVARGFEEVYVDELFYGCFGWYLESLRGWVCLDVFNLDFYHIFFQFLQINDMYDCIFL